jgi:L-amino acid N-acyltransferase YncA
LSTVPCTAADIPVVARIYAHAVVTGRASFETEPPGVDIVALLARLP